MPGRDVHRGLQRYLLPGERTVAEIRPHGIVLVKPALVILVATLIAGWLDVSVSDASSGVLTWIWFAWLAVLVWSAWQWIEWRNTRVVATDKRIVLFEGWLKHKVSMMPLKKVTDMAYERSIPGRILGYGTFILESAGQDQALSRIDFVPHPDANYRAITGEIFGIVDPEDEGGDKPPAWGSAQDYATRLGIVDGVYVGPVQDQETGDGHHPGGASIYRSQDRVRRDRDADTGELPPYDPGSTWP